MINPTAADVTNWKSYIILCWFFFFCLSFFVNLFKCSMFFIIIFWISMNFEYIYKWMKNTFFNCKDCIIATIHVGRINEFVRIIYRRGALNVTFDRLFDYLHSSCIYAADKNTVDAMYHCMNALLGSHQHSIKCITPQPSTFFAYQTLCMAHHQTKRILRCLAVRWKSRDIKPQKLFSLRHVKSSSKKNDWTECSFLLLFCHRESWMKFTPACCCTINTNLKRPTTKKPFGMGKPFGLSLCREIGEIWMAKWTILCLQLQLIGKCL